MLKKVFLVIIAFIFFISILLATHRNKTAEYAQIKVNGNVVKTVKLKSECEIIEIENIKLKILDNKISIIKSTCKDKICERKGFIHIEGDMIVCLPNKTVVEIVKEKN
ncbi:NusG domain II-containing protein [Clostridium tarantellae]|nr:NusG domain II-containing protein [Clostridium tarantellae]